MPVIKFWLFQVFNLIGWELKRKEKIILGKSPSKYQYNIKQTSDENEEKYQVSWSNTKFFNHKNCIADNKKTYWLDFSVSVTVLNLLTPRSNL